MRSTFISPIRNQVEAIRRHLTRIEMQFECSDAPCHNTIMEGCTVIASAFEQMEQVIANELSNSHDFAADYVTQLASVASHELSITVS